MTTSGTVNTTQYPVNKIIEQALRRCGIASSTINAEMLQVGRDNLFLLLTSALANRGLNLWEVKRASLSLTIGVASYDLPDGCVDLLNMLFKNSMGSEITMARMNRDDYASLPVKTTQGIPTQYWYNRQIRPQVTLWPTPGSAAAAGSLSIFYHRQIEDVGALTNTLDIPTRWLETVITGLAARMMMEFPQVDMARYGLLQAAAADALAQAEAEETDSSPINIAPDLSVYTR